MFKTLIAATALLAATVAPALAKDSARTFTRDGETYEYTSVNKGDHVVISGRSLTSGSAFKLRVRGSRIIGMSGGVPVNFTVTDAQAKLTTTELASR
jgi:hypothetical protein